MGVRHFPNRQTQWYVNYRHPYLLDDKGKPKRIYEPFDNEDDAKKRDAKVKYQLKYEREVFLPENHEENAGDDSLRVDDVLMLYLKDIAARKKDRRFAKKNMKTTLDHLKYVRPIIGNIAVEELCKADMRKVVTELRKDRVIDQTYTKKGRAGKTIKRKMKGCGQSTINRKVGIIKSALNWAEEQELIEENPIRHFKAPRGPNNKPDAPTPDEINKILLAASDHVRRVVVIGVGTGARVGPSELFDVKWSDLSPDCKTLRIHSADKNTAISCRDIDLKPTVTVALRIWREIDAKKGNITGHIIYWNSKPVNSIKHAWSNTLERADITRRIRPYDCRHHFITQALRKKCDLKAISTIVGHADPTMILRHYQDVVAESLQEVMNSVTELEMPEIGTGPQDLREQVLQ